MVNNAEATEKSFTFTFRVAARIAEAQLMGWRLSIAPAGSENWRALGEAEAAAVTSAGVLELAAFDPESLPNGIYRLRLTAWDLAGRASEIEARVLVDTPRKTGSLQSADALMTLGA